ncbi:MAG: hypothetical protein AB1420_15935 [Bacillota bacterium]
MEIKTIERAKKEKLPEVQAVIDEILKSLPQGWEVRGYKSASYRFALEVLKDKSVLGTLMTDKISNLPQYVAEEIQRLIEKENAKTESEALREVFYSLLPALPEKVEEKKVEEKKEKSELEKTEKKIASEKEAIELAKKLNLQNQVGVHSEKLQLREREKKALLAGYNFIREDINVKRGYSVDEYPDAIPLEGLQTLDKALNSALFDDFRVWVEYNDDPILVGRVIVGERKTAFELFSW